MNLTVHYLILCIVIRNQCITFFLTKVVFVNLIPSLWKLGGFWGANLVVVFGFSGVKTIRITLNFNREWNKILCRQNVIKAKNRRRDNIEKDLIFDGLLWTGFIWLRADLNGRWRSRRCCENCDKIKFSIKDLKFRWWLREFSFQEIEYGLDSSGSGYGLITVCSEHRNVRTDFFKP